MNAECNDKGICREDKYDKCWYFIIPMTFVLDKDETRELGDIIIESISVSEDFKIQTPRTVEVYPADYLKTVDVCPPPAIKSRPIHIRAEGTNRQNNLCLKIPIMTKADITKYETFSGSITIRLPFYNSYPIRLLLNFECSGDEKLLNVISLKRAEPPYLIIVNLILIVVLILLLHLWNDWINKNTYSSVINPQRVQEAIIFLCGFFGLPVLSTLPKLCSLSALQSLVTYPELYLNPILVTYVRMRLTTILLAVAYVPMVVFITLNWGYTVPNATPIWGKGTKWVDTSGNEVSATRVSRSTLVDSSHRVLRVFEDLELKDMNELNKFALGYLKLYDSTSWVHAPMEAVFEPQNFWISFSEYFSACGEDHNATNPIQLCVGQSFDQHACVKDFANPIINILSNKPNNSVSYDYDCSYHSETRKFIIKLKTEIQYQDLESKINSHLLPYLRSNRVETLLNLPIESLIKTLNLGTSDPVLHQECFNNIYTKYIEKFKTFKSTNDAIHSLFVLYTIFNIYIKHGEIAEKYVYTVLKDFNDHYAKNSAEDGVGSRPLLRSYLRLLLNLAKHSSERRGIILDNIQKLITNKGYDVYMIYLIECVNANILNNHEPTASVFLKEAFKIHKSQLNNDPEYQSVLGQASQGQYNKNTSIVIESLVK